MQRRCIVNALEGHVWRCQDGTRHSFVSVYDEKGFSEMKSQHSTCVMFCSAVEVSPNRDIAIKKSH